MNTMSAENIITQTDTAGEAVSEAVGEATTNLNPEDGAPAAVTVRAPGSVATDADADVDDDPIVKLRINTTHVKCGGIIFGRHGTKVDPTVLCGKPTTLPALVPRHSPSFESNLVGSVIHETDPQADTEYDNFYENILSELTYDQLDEEIHLFLDTCGDHGAAEDQRLYLALEYVYDEEGREAESLECVDDNEFRRIIGAGSGFINVVWRWLGDVTR